MARALRVEKSVQIKSDSDAVFEAMTCRDGLSQWFADGASNDLQEGSTIEFQWGSGRDARKSRARVLRVQAGKCVMMRWEDGFAHAKDDYFSLTLKKKPRGSVEVTVIDFATKDALEDLQDIWDECLERLKGVLED